MRVQIKVTIMDAELRQKITTALQSAGFEASMLGPDVYGTYDGNLSGLVLAQLRLTAENEQKDQSQRMLKQCLNCDNCDCEHD